SVVNFRQGISPACRRSPCAPRRAKHAREPGMRFVRSGAIAVALLVTLGSTAKPQPAVLPPPVIPEGLGVNIHFTDPRPGEMKMLADAGFRWVRMDFAWSAVETEPGKYDFSAYDRLTAALAQYRIRAIFILDYSNKLYDNDLSPHSDAGRAAFARWAAASA